MTEREHLIVKLIVSLLYVLNYAKEHETQIYVDLKIFWVDYGVGKGNTFDRFKS